MERSLNFIISYIAILKAGGAYFPIEMNNPIENTKKQMKTAGCSKIITNQ